MKFRKKPLIVEAEQWTLSTPVEGVHFGEYWDFEAGVLKEGPILKTLEGTFEVLPGDWIVTGLSGEKWPVKHEIFVKSYEAVAESE